MDMFQYTLRIKEIDNLKTLKSKDAIIRGLITDAGYTHWGSIETTAEETALYYKCIMKVLQTYSKDRSPEFIRTIIERMEYQLTSYYTANKTPYKTWVDTFQYNETVELAQPSVATITTVALIFGDSPIPFKFIYKHYAGSAFSDILHGLPTFIYTKTDVTNTSGITPIILQVEEIKRSLPSEIKYSILEDILDQLYAIIPSVITNTADKIDTITNSIVERMEHRLTVAKTFRERLMKG